MASNLGGCVVAEGNALCGAYSHQGAWPDDGAANLVVRTVDVAEPVRPKDAELWESLKEKPLPRVALRYPPVSRITVPVRFSTESRVSSAPRSRGTPRRSGPARTSSPKSPCP